MIRCFAEQDRMLVPVDPEAEPDRILWIDLLDPSPEEAARAGELLGAAVPSRAEMEEIELSSRLYQDRGVHHVTIVVPAQTQDRAPVVGPVTFLLSGGRLATVRFNDPRPFDTYPARAGTTSFGCARPEAVMLGLIEEIIDRLADILERIGRDIEQISRQILSATQVNAKNSRDMRAALERIGRAGDLVGDIRVSLMTLERAFGYLGQVLVAQSAGRDVRAALHAATADAHSLAEHAGFLSQKIGLMLDATLGMINIEQNATIKIFTVVAVLLMPPTLIASIYGMNFAAMPELGWRYGYPAALGLMVLSALIAFLFFRRRGWM